MNKDAMFSSASDEWETPDWFFQLVDHVTGYSFTLDVCASFKNTKCCKYFSVKENGLLQDWANNICWMNPPYSQSDLWVKKAYEESQKDNTIVVCLLPARTDTRRFHDYCMKASDIYFVKGRIKFLDMDGNVRNSPAFPSIVVIFKKHKQTSPIMRSMKFK
jgi:phage N-6-adenine-methyltransferase